MTPPPEVVTVLKCPCGRYIPSGGLSKHLQVCSKLQEDIAASDSDGDDDGDIRGSGKPDQDGVLVVEFKAPCVILERLSISEITAAGVRTEVQKTETVQDVKRVRKRKRKTSTSLEESDADADNSNDDEYNEASDESDDDFDELVEKKRNASKRLKRNQSSRQHASVADDQYNHKCNVCPTKFKSKNTFDWHMLNIHGAGSKKHEIITCPLCGRMLNKRLVFQNHLKGHENAEALEEAFDLWNKWPAPKKTSKMATKFNCKYCLIPHTSQHSFLTHMKVEHPGKGRFCKYLCQYCEISEFDSMKHFIFHMRTAHLEEYYGKTIKWGLSDPMKQSGRPKGKCDICNKMLDVFYLRSHKERAHKDKINMEKDGDQTQDDEETDDSLKCPMLNCYSKFKNRALLKSHFILHLKNNPFKCKFPGCQVQCDAQCHLDRHMKLHASPLIPCPKCGVHYSRIDKLKQHVCCFDVSKLKYDENGHLRQVNAFSRLKRVQSENAARTGQEPKDDGEPQETKKDISKPKIDFETENDHVRDETKSEEVQFPKEFKSYNRRVNINAIIAADPVFIQVCEKNPNFKELILGRKQMIRAQNTQPSRRKPKPYRRQITECSKCGKVLVNLTSLARHWRLIHGIILKPQPVLNDTKKINRTGSKKNAKKIKKKPVKKTTLGSFKSKTTATVTKSKVSASKDDNNELDCSIVKTEIHLEPVEFTEDCDIIIKSEMLEEHCIKTESAELNMIDE